MAQPKEVALDLDLDAIEDLEPSVTFRLGGREWHCRHREDVPFSVTERMLPLLQGGNDAATLVVQIGPIMQALIVREEVDDFMAMLREPNSPVTIRRMQRLLETLMTTVLSDGKRPTQPSAGSSSGRRNTGRTSGARSSGRATPKRASAG